MAEEDEPPVAIQRALRLIKVHPSVVRVTTERVEGTETTLAIVEIRTEMANAWRAARISPSGVREIEPVSLLFGAGYPLRPPRIMLRGDFNRSHPHIQPSRGNGSPEPCLVAGSLRELLRVRGIGGLVEQLVDWLDKAAAAELIDPQQGWEPVRRDNVDDIIVADAGWLTRIPTRDGGCSVFRAWFYASRDSDAVTYRIGLPESGTVPMGPKLTEQWAFTRIDDTDYRGSTHALVAWSGKLPTGKPFVAGQYAPETVASIDELLVRAAELGCRRFLEPKLRILEDRIATAKLKIVQPIAVLLLARRPCNVIGTDSPIEICPYVVELRGKDALASGSGQPVRTAMHRDEVGPELLRRAAGDDGICLPPWTLVGCGSIGSKIAIHLARSGRAPSAVVDRAIMQPHNFARHGLLPSENRVESFLPIPKAYSLALALETFKQPSKPHAVDVVAHAIEKNSIAGIVAPNSFALINTTGSASVREAMALPAVAVSRPRIVETCILGIGTVGLISVEGPQANPSTIDLLCEAYLTIHSDRDLRAEVFNTSAEAVAVGQGCSTLTMPLSDGRLSSLAAPMAEHVRRLQRDGLPDAGEVLIGRLALDGLSQTWSRAPVAPRIVLDNGSSIVRLAPGADRTILDEIESRPGSETGGILVGRFSDVSNTFHIVGIMSAPPDSKFSRDEFILGTEGLKPKLRDLIEGSGGALYALGTWHNHLVPSGPSRRDVETAAKLAIRQYFPLLMLIRTPAGYVHFTTEAVSSSGGPTPTDCEGMR